MSRGAAGLVLRTGVAWAGPLWVAWRRRGWGRAARALTPSEAGPLVGYFSGELLRRVRVAEVRRIDLWAPLGRVGERLAARGGMVGWPAGLALDDLIVVAAGMPERELRRESLLFHEMVHVVQWRVLGRRRFLREYVGSWAAAGRAYGEIPLEVMAYELQERFDAGERFDAEGEVRERLG